MISARKWSRPSRARGLKQNVQFQANASVMVAPFTGAWIETRSAFSAVMCASGRALHGRVD